VVDMTEQEYRISLGAYLLGALDADETKALQCHLLICTGCQREYLELSETLGALAAIPPDAAAAGLSGMPPEDPAPRRARGETRVLPAWPVWPAGPEQPAEPEQPALPAGRPAARRRRLPAVAATAVAAAAVLVGALLGGTVLAGRSTSGGQPTHVAERTVTGANPATGVSAVVALFRHDGGTYLDATLTGDLQRGWRCQLVVFPRAGRSEQAGGREVTEPGRTMRLDGSVAIPVEDIARIQLRRGDREIILVTLVL
jgi:hypothetical protein